MGLLERTVRTIRPLDEKAMEQALARQNNLTKPQGSLGRLEELSVQLAGIQSSPVPVIKNKAIVVMAADHGVAASGVSAYPSDVTKQMVLNFLNEGAGVNVIARKAGARVAIVDIGVAAEMNEHPMLRSRKIMHGTNNMEFGPAMTREQAVASIEAGIDIVEEEIKKGLDIVGTGDMGIGNTTASSAICAAITGSPVEAVTGRGTGVDDGQFARKVAVITSALAVNQPDPSDAVEVLRMVGGLEIGGIAGIILGAAAHRIPVVIDGFISGAGALIAATLSPLVAKYCIAAHLSVEAGHRIMLDYLGLQPLVSLDMRLGEGTGAGIGIMLADMAVSLLSDMATFGEAGVSGRNES